MYSFDKNFFVTNPVNILYKKESLVQQFFLFF
jgi:hypothetical protein